MRAPETFSYTIPQLEPYIHWLYFFHAWGLSARYGNLSQVHQCPACRAAWVESFPEGLQGGARQAIALYDEACRVLLRMEADGFRVHTRFALYDAWGDGDDIVVCQPALRLPMLRQQSGDGPFLSLADFVKPCSHGGTPDQIGVFATSVSATGAERWGASDYGSLLVETLLDRLAEAAAERLHVDVRRTIWAYAPDEQLTPAETLQCRYQGIRPAVGYPSLPDQSLNFLLDALLDYAAIGIRLTENGAMHPHASTSGLMIAHPKSHYFSIGPIGFDQLSDYARRRGLDLPTAKRFLAANIANAETPDPIANAMSGNPKS